MKIGGIAMKTIGIYPNMRSDAEFLGTCRVIDSLCGKAEMMMPETLKDKVVSCRGTGACDNIAFVSFDSLFSLPDAVVVLGGDGTILEAARHCVRVHEKCGKVMPLLGINLGRIGYMAELELDELWQIDRLLDGDYSVEQRMMLETEIDGERFLALNEAVIGGASVFRIVEIELYCDGKLVNRYRADGLIASTPTGSTAYSMSAGGAVVDPRMEAVIITPICSHSLSATPLVFSAESEFAVKNVTTREECLYISVDGGKAVPLSYGHEVKLRRSAQYISLIRLKEGGFYERLRRKMSDK